MSTPVVPRGTDQGKEPRTIWRKKERSSSSKEGNSVAQRREGGARLTQITAVYLGVSGAEWNSPQIHSSHSYAFSLMIWPLQQVSDHT